MPLGLLTYNIRGLPWISCPIEAIFLWITWKVDCQICCLQEVFGKGLREKILALSKSHNWIPIFPDQEPTSFGKRFLRFATPSGLCILVRPSIQILNIFPFVPFLSQSGLDRVVNKGFFAINIRFKGHILTILNTHFQSDFTEFPCFRIPYPAIRDLQESQLFHFVRQFQLPILVGDFNKNRFFFFDRFDPSDTITFPTTGEHLDHLLIPRSISTHFLSKKTTYFSDTLLSDHVPVLFEFDL